MRAFHPGMIYVFLCILGCTEIPMFVKRYSHSRDKPEIEGRSYSKCNCNHCKHTVAASAGGKSENVVNMVNQPFNIAGCSHNRNLILFTPSALPLGFKLYPASLFDLPLLPADS